VSRQLQALGAVKHVLECDLRENVAAFFNFRLILLSGCNTPCYEILNHLH
jgi:hypothetical protein